MPSYKGEVWNNPAVFLLALDRPVMLSKAFSTATVALYRAVKGSQQVHSNNSKNPMKLHRKNANYRFISSCFIATCARSANKATVVAMALSITWDSVVSAFGVKPSAHLVMRRQLTKHKGRLHLATWNPQHSKCVVTAQKQAATRNPPLC